MSEPGLPPLDPCEKLDVEALLGVVDEVYPIELPDSVAEKLALLTADEVAFLESSDARDFAGDLDDTLEALDEVGEEAVAVRLQRGETVADLHIPAAQLARQLDVVVAGHAHGGPWPVRCG